MCRCYGHLIECLPLQGYDLLHGLSSLVNMAGEVHEGVREGGGESRRC